jgi:uncharacterized membrane protein
MKIQASATKLLFFLSKITKRIWFRAFLYALLGVSTAFVALFVRGIFPDDLSSKIGADAIGDILTILAASMLTVATFSIAIMVTAFGNVSSSATPRATRLLIENQSAQRAVSTFIGAFLYSIVAIIALATQAYGSEGRFILFLVTIVVIIMIVVTLIKWLDQLSTLGQVTDTLAEVETATFCSIKQWAQDPFLGGNKLEKDSLPLDAEFELVISENVGFLVLVDAKAVQKICEERGVKIFLLVLPGSFIFPNRPLAKVSPKVDPKCLKDITSQFIIESIRTFDQDPGFGFVLLSEIASRALSPGINDPGTALDVLNSATRLLKKRSDLVRKTDVNPRVVSHSRIYIPMLEGDLHIESVFAPISRDGAGIVEVCVRIQEALKALKAYDPEYQVGCDLYAKFAKEYANLSLKTQFEKDLVENSGRQVSSSLEKINTRS